MEFPKQIHDFMLHDVAGNWTYKGKVLQSANYIRLGSRMNLFIQTVADKEGNLEYIIRLRDSFVRGGIRTMEEAVQIAKEIIEENKLFIEKSVL
ncbi:hypothetical protein [Desulfosarcina ovata]|uniref:Uncharacterized protein n=2 Tax=Desulfosarcina ovata TaxID=83564 RepID=A0A5K8AGH1_9BACT|nr:hypothetical protein [Desulfosarcina ovata]BBO84960.1 hypothetical protein DSCO28_55260 [Desulfosarcina ovata subsp. sediminis]BBO91721.1 hypothetical protein DSCOOX_49010 [Desulfosarcina ovata subsp. ovata]